MSEANHTVLAIWLEEIGQSQKWLAKSLGNLSYQAVQHWVSGRRKIPIEHLASIRTLMLNTGYNDLALGGPKLIESIDSKGYFDWR